MGRVKNKEERIKCGQCMNKTIHIGNDGRPFLDHEGKPILFECRRQRYSFGEWQTVAECKYYKGSR